MNPRRMVISKQKNFIYIHIWKTAGTSLRMALKPYDSRSCYARGLSVLRLPQALVRDPYQRSYDVHSTYRDVESIFPRSELEHFWIFGVVRNPWSWHVSLYHYMRQQESHYQRELANSFRDFSAYIAWREEAEPITQIDFLTDSKGQLAVDYVGKMENLDELVGLLKDRFEMDIRLPVMRVSKHRHYTEYYKDKGLIEAVERMNSRDINEFGYEFS